MQRLQKINKFIIASALVVSSVCYLLMPSVASAATDYDDSYQDISNIVVNSTRADATCSSHDISSSWYSYIIDSSKWQNPSDASNPASDMSMAKASFEAALDHGRWAVSQRSEYNASWGGSYTNYVNVLWAENTDMELIWEPDHSVFASAPYARYITITCGQAFGVGDNPVATQYSIGSPGPISNSMPYDPNPSSYADDNGIANFFVYTNYPNYPHSPGDYEGTLVASNPQGAIISGNVQCANSNNIITKVYISTLSSTNGDALLSDDGIGGKDYRFYLWDGSPYQLIVTCDGDLFSANWIEDDLYDYYTWACVPTSVSHFPNNDLYTCSGGPSV